MKIADLDALIRAVCPIDGINSSGAIWFKESATIEQKAAAVALMSENLPTLEL